MKLNDNDIIELSRELMSEKTPRNAVYADIDKVIYDAKFIGKIDDHLDSQVRQSKRLHLLVNYLKARVADKMNILSIPPDPKYTVTGKSAEGMGEDEAMFWGSFIEKVNLWLWRLSHMSSQFKDMGQMLGMYGTSVEMVVPDMKEKNVKIVLRHPAHTYAQLKLGSSREYDHVMFISRPTGRQIVNAYPSASSFVNYDNNGYLFIEFWDENRRLFYVKDRRIPGIGIEHNLGFIPIRVTPDSLRNYDNVEGLPGVYQEIGLQENMNELLMLSTADARERLSSLLMIKDGKSVPDPIPRGPGHAIEVGPEGDMRYVAVPGNPHDIAAQLQTQEHLLRVATNWPAIRSGSGADLGSIVTGKTISGAQAGVADDVQSTKDRVKYDMILIDEYAIAMLKRLFNKKDMFASGKEKQKPFGFSFKPEEIPDNFEHDLDISPLGHDIPSMIVTMLQLYGPGQGRGVLDLRSVLERLPGVNPAEVITRLEEDAKRGLKLQVMAQTLAQEMLPPEEQPTPEGIEEATHAAEKGGLPGA